MGLNTPQPFELMDNNVEVVRVSGRPIFSHKQGSPQSPFYNLYHGTVTGH